MAYEGQAVVSDANASSAESANKEPASQEPTSTGEGANVALTEAAPADNGSIPVDASAGPSGLGGAVRDGYGLAGPRPEAPRLEASPTPESPGLEGPRRGIPGEALLGFSSLGAIDVSPASIGIGPAKGPELPTGNLTELAQLLALAIAQNQAARSTPAATNSELTSLATLVSNAGAQRTLAPAFKDGLSALSYSRPPAKPIRSLPALQDEVLDDDEPMPIPSTWRQPAPRDDDGWIRQQMGAALLGLVAGLIIVVPSVLWMSGWLEGAKQNSSRTVTASLEPRPAEVRTVKVQVRSLEKPVETAAQFVAGSLEPRLVTSSARSFEPSAVEASAAEAREAEAREAEAREAEAREAQAKEAEAREAQAREAEAKAAQEREAEARAAAARAAEARAAEAKAAEARAAEARAAEAKAAEARAADARAAEARAAEARAAEMRAAEARAAEAKAAKARAEVLRIAEARARQDSLLGRARQRVETGDIGGAREILAAGDDGAQGHVLFALAETYDPNMLAAWGSRGVTADVARARSLYQKALGLGVANAKIRLEALQ